MDERKARRLRAKGWRIGNAKEFLGLSEEEAAYVEMTLAVSRLVRESRLMQEMTQEDLAKRIGSSQSRVAKLEAGDPSVSFDLRIRAVLAAGASRKQIARAVEAAKRE